MDSVVSAKFSAVSPTPPAPKPPEIKGVTFNRLTANVDLLMPKTDVDGQPLAEPITNIKVTWKAEGLPGGEKNVPGKFDSGQEYKVDIDVPAWNTSYDFEAVVTV